jgi:alginate O-acetyltransferase complex protein AlgI
VTAVFLFSGLAHDLVISVPAGGGYGLPTLYFTLHGAGVMLEKRGALSGSRWLTAAAVVGPLPVLFHPSFMTRVVAPLVAGQA